MLLLVIDPKRVSQPVRDRVGRVSVTLDWPTTGSPYPKWAFLHARWTNGSETGTLQIEPREIFEAAKLLDTFGGA